MVTAALTVAFTWCLFYGRLAQPLPVVICVASGLFFAYFSGHRHSRDASIDAIAQTSRMKNINPALKFWTLLILIVICVASDNPFTGVFLITVTFILAIFANGRGFAAGLYQHVHILAPPVSFLLIGGLALLFEVSAGPTGIVNIRAPGFWIVVSENAQIQTALVVSRAFGAVSCLCLLSVTTPMPQIIGVLRRARCPELIIDLMYLIYRYIFILLSLHREMRDAAKSRLGFRDYRSSMRSTGRIYANLLARSYQFAARNFDAMESRCYDTGIKFLEQRIQCTFSHVLVSAMLLLASVGVSLLPA